MRKRIMGACIMGIMAFGIYKYAQTAEAPVAKSVTAFETFAGEFPNDEKTAC